jgi:hydrogenase nickel incorporation protein HypB
MLVTKLDLLPHVQFDVERCKEGTWQVHPGLEVIALSAMTGEGIDQWIDWLAHQYAHKAGVTHAHHA